MNLGKLLAGLVLTQLVGTGLASVLSRPSPPHLWEDSFQKLRPSPEGRL